MRVVAFDYGKRRIGVAVSDPTGMLARPTSVLQAGDPVEAVVLMSREVARLGEDDGVSGIVLGLPRRLDGSPTEMTALVQAIVAPLEARTGLPVTLQDERLSSHEAEGRLAVTERDWRKRKAQLDAAAAAVILQDYLDAHPRGEGL